MNLVKEGLKIRHTTQLTLPVSVENNPVARIERRLSSFINNPDWIYDTLSLIEKALNNNTVLNIYDNWALNRLDLTAEVSEGTLILKDRYFVSLKQDELLKLSDKIISMTVKHANKLLKEPKLHHMERSFKRALRRAEKRSLIDEELSILKDAYLKIENGKVVNLRGEQVNVPKYNFLKLLIA